MSIAHGFPAPLQATARRPFPERRGETGRAGSVRDSMTSNGSDTHAVGRNARVFYGWWIVLVAFICHAVNTGMIFYAWGVFFLFFFKASGPPEPFALPFPALLLA